MQILITSPVTPVRQSLRVLLEQAGHKVVVAESLKIALERISQNLLIDAVICEWKLAPGTAHELKSRSAGIDRLTDSGVGQPVPSFVVLVTPDPATGVSDLQQCDDIRAMGFDDVLPKPIDRTALIQCLNDIARRRIRPTPVSEARQAEIYLPPAEDPQRQTGSVPRPLGIKPVVTEEQFRDLEGEVLSLEKGAKALHEQLQSVSKSLRTIATEFQRSAATDAEVSPPARDTVLIPAPPRSTAAILRDAPPHFNPQTADASSGCPASVTTASPV